jgi:2-dehydropantoate 2-reductase
VPTETGDRMAGERAAASTERGESSTPTRHAILGMGGVGGLLGALLAKAGDEVTAVLRPETLAQFPPSLSLESPLGSFSVPVRCATVVGESFDVLWIAVKATHLEAALLTVKDTNRLIAVVPLLNGIDHLPILRDRFGDERVVPATISVESERVAPGRIVHRSPFLRLSVLTRGEPRLPVLVKLRQFGCSVQFVADEPTLMWSKLAFLAPFALATSAAGRALGDIMGDPTWKTRLDRCCREACAVGIASGAQLDAVRIAESFASLPAGSRSSMQKDVAAGNTPELDAIAGPIITRGRRLGIDVSVTSELAEAVRARVAARKTSPKDPTP